MIQTGTIKFYNWPRGFGYLIPDDGGGDVYVNAADADSRDLRSGVRVIYMLGRRNGRECAKQVRLAA